MKRILVMGFVLIGGCTCSLPQAPVNRPTPVATAAPLPERTVKPGPTSMPPIDIPPPEILQVSEKIVVSGKPFVVTLCGHASFELINLFVDGLFSGKMAFDQKSKCHSTSLTLMTTKKTKLDARVGFDAPLSSVYITPLDR